MDDAVLIGIIITQGILFISSLIYIIYQKSRNGNRHNFSLDEESFLHFFPLFAADFNEIIYIHDTKKIIYINDAIEKMSGLGASDFIGVKLTNLLKYIHPQDRELLQERQNNAYQDSCTVLTFRFMSRTKKPVWIQLYPSSKIKINNKEFVMGIGHDISYLKKQEDETEQLNRQLNLVARISKMSFWEWTSARGIYNVEKSFLRILGLDFCDKKNLLSSLEKVLHPQDFHDYLIEKEALLMGRKNNSKLEFRVLNNRDEWIWLHIQCSVISKNNHGQANRILGIISDISPLKKAQIESQQKNRFLKQIFDHIPFGLLAKDPKQEFRYTVWNKYFKDLSGISRDEAIGMKDKELFPATVAEFFSADDESVLEEGSGILEKEVCFNLPEKKEQVLRIIKFPLVSADENNKLVFMVCEDVSRRYKLEEDLRQAQKMEAVGQLAGGIAHDFNNQIQGIFGFSELLYVSLKDREQLEYLKALMDCAKRAADMTGQLLAFARKGKHKNEAIDIHEILSELQVLLKRTIDPRINIYSELAEQDLFVFGDPSQIQNVLLNISLNAKDAMPEGGDLVYKTNTVLLDGRFCANLNHPLQPGEYIKISIIDTGIGMDDQVLSRIFEPFFTTKGVGKGTGMGLAAAYGTIQNHNGTIEVKSQLGRGTAFFIYLPKSRIEKPQDSQEDLRLPADDIHKHVLVIDDDMALRSILRLKLQQLDCRVFAAETGTRGLEYFSKNNKDIDLVLLDMLLPDMTGIEVFHELQRINPSVNIVLCSGIPNSPELKLLLDEPNTRLLEKPFHLSEIQEILKPKK